MVSRRLLSTRWDCQGGAYDKLRGNSRNWIMVWEDGFLILVLQQQMILIQVIMEVSHISKVFNLRFNLGCLMKSITMVRDWLGKSQQIISIKNLHTMTWEVQFHYLWVIKPLMAEGSCLHLMKISYPEGFEEYIICSILKETLKALEYLHRHGHIHRDVKVGNILLDNSG